MPNHDLIFGIHAVTTALHHDASQVVEVHLLHESRKNPRLRDIMITAEERGVPITFRSREELDTLVDGGVHQGVVARAAIQMPKMGEHELLGILQNLDEPALLLILDGIQDPHNLGACLRSADAAGVHAVIAPKDRAVGLTPTVRKVACGGAEHVPFIQVTNLARTLEELKQAGVWLIGAVANASELIYDIDLKGSIALVMGAEEKGLRRLTQESCDFLAKIPNRGRVESLNVSVATGICLFEAVRQRGQSATEYRL